MSVQEAVFETDRNVQEAGEKAWTNTYRGYFETLFPPKSPWLAGNIKMRVLDSGIAPNNIIRIEDEWYVDVYWSLTGTLQSLIGGEWCIHLHMESIGKGKEFNYPEERRAIRVPVDPCGDGHYHYRLKVPAGLLDTRHCSSPYETAVTVTLYDVCGYAVGITGVVKGPMLHFHEGKKRHNGHVGHAEKNGAAEDA